MTTMTTKSSTYEDEAGPYETGFTHEDVSPWNVEEIGYRDTGLIGDFRSQR